MQLLFFEEFIRLLLHQSEEDPKLFVDFFNESNFLIGYNYRCSEHRFTHVSKSFRKILGYHQNNIVSSNNFISKIIHPQDKKNLTEYLKRAPTTNSEAKSFTCIHSVNHTKCRTKHINGYWKYFFVFNIDYKNPLTKSIDKIGLFADEHVKPEHHKIARKKATYRSGSKSKLYIPVQKTIKKEDIITHRESEVLKLISEGMITKEIAELMNISTSTVITHRKNLISKFEVHNTAELINRAAKLMLI